MSAKKSTIPFEVAVIIAATLLAAVAGHFLNIFEFLYNLSVFAKWLNLDQIILPFLVLTIGLIWLSVRRYHELRRVADDREKSQLELQQTRLQFDRLLSNLKGEYFFYRHNTDGVFELVSPSVTDVLGYTVEEFCKHYTVYLTDDPINKEVEKHTELSI
ncbi:MAG: hypothetical protein D6800_13765, partial [Candidatus Zixiibacteriota bacterium]